MQPDFIIVGAGSAGCAMAEQLSASGRHKVLVLEAGPSDRRFWIQMPLGYGKTFYDARVNWCYDAEPDPGLAGNKDFWPRGKVLGGSSSINAMVWIRGQQEDYEDWQRAGNPGWGWRDVLPVYKRIEDHDLGADDYRGAGGPLHITDVFDRVHPLTHRYIEACKSAGLPFLADPNGATQEGCCTYPITTKNARRVSSARAFLRPAMRRGNVKVETGAQITRILFEGRRAVGVEYRQGGVPKEARAAREVILSAGAVNTPQLLQLSGIGPAELLRAHGIAVLQANDNVGKHLQDHAGINYTYRSKLPTLNRQLRSWPGKLLAGADWLLRGRGPLSLCLNHGGGFFRTSPDRTRPNFQLYFQAFSTLISKVGERPLLHPDPFEAFSIGLSNCRPTSRGSIAIRSADPFKPPQINGSAFGTEHDVGEMLQAVKFIRTIAAQPAMASVIAEELKPGPAIQSDDDLIADFRKRSGTVYHPSCTCRMGPDPASAVVDARLKVHGLDGLRIADASVFPNIISGNTNAPSILVGMKGAGLILEDSGG
jgi:choline dehydrogenase